MVIQISIILIMRITSHIETPCGSHLQLWTNSLQLPPVTLGLTLHPFGVKMCQTWQAEYMFTSFFNDILCLSLRHFWLPKGIAGHVTQTERTLRWNMQGGLHRWVSVPKTLARSSRFPAYGCSVCSNFWLYLLSLHPLLRNRKKERNIIFLKLHAPQVPKVSQEGPAWSSWRGASNTAQQRC